MCCIVILNSTNGKSYCDEQCGLSEEVPDTGVVCRPTRLATRPRWSNGRVTASVVRSRCYSHIPTPPTRSHLPLFWAWRSQHHAFRPPQSLAGGTSALPLIGKSWIACYMAWHSQGTILLHVANTFNVHFCMTGSHMSWRTGCTSWSVTQPSCSAHRCCHQH